MTFTPSPQQAAAIRAIVDWYRNPHRKQPVFRLFGYAGSGKSRSRRMPSRRSDSRRRAGTAVPPAACCSPPSPARPRW